MTVEHHRTRSPGKIDPNIAPSFTPLTVSNLVFWLDVNRGLWQDTGATTPATANSDPVARWDDQSGNGNYHSTGGTAPSLVASAINGHRGVGFGSGRLLETVNTFGGIHPYTMYMVMKFTSTGGAQVFQSAAGGNPPEIYIDGQYKIYAGGGNPGGGTPDTNPHVLTFILNGGSSFVYIDGSAVISAGTGGSAATRFRLGTDNAGQSFSGYMCDIAVYSAAQSDPDRIALQRFFGAKFGITVP